LAAAVLVAVDDGCAAEGALENGLEVRVRRSLCSVRCGEDPLRGRELDGRVEVGAEGLRDRHRAVVAAVAALRDVGAVRAPHGDGPVAQVDIFFLESQQFAASQAEEERRREQRAPRGRERGQDARYVFRRDRRSPALRLLELRYLEP